MYLRRFFTLIVLILPFCHANADNWSLYRGAAGDGISSESLQDVQWRQAKLNVVWKSKTPLGFSSFAVADGRAFTIVGGGGTESLLALDAKSGNKLWQFPMGSSKYKQGGGGAGAPGNKGGDGPRSTPAVSGDRVYVYDSYMNLQCFDAKSGKLIWNQDVIADHKGRNVRWLNATSPIVYKDAVIVGGGGEGQSFLAFDKMTGDVIWKSGNEKITHATPTLANFDGLPQIIFFTQSGPVAIDVSNGNEIWRTKFPFSTSTAASPVVSDNLVYCSAGYGVGAGLFEVSGNEEPSEVWFKANELMNHWSTPLAYEGHLYGIFEFKKYGRAPLNCVDLKTGEVKWSQRGFGPGNCILVGDKLVVLSDAGEVAIVKATPDGYQELTRSKVLSGKCWSTPAFSDGKIFVRSTEEAACIEIGN